MIRLSSIGDIVNALPAVAALGQTFPAAEITWAVEARYACLLGGNPYVRHTIQLDTLGWRKRLGSPRTWGEIAGGVRALRHTRYDTVVDFQALVKTGLMTWLCRSGRRVGFAAYIHREKGAGLFYTETVAPPPAGHVIGEYMALVKRLGAETGGTWQFPLPSPPSARDKIEAELAVAGVREFAIVNPGGGWDAKRWPPANYAVLIARLQDEVPGDVVLTGSPSEESMIREIIRGSGRARAIYLPTTILQFIALARKAKLFIGGDTGPMHLAAALGVPIVAIYGPTDPARNGPFSAVDIALTNRSAVNHTRRGPGHKFLEGVAVEDVLAAVHERLARERER
ncbi:MAG: glycosyltransferase family 9 protein [Terriglobia bacterium]